jgi:NADH-quinone oxidoreductase subunit G
VARQLGAGDALILLGSLAEAHPNYAALKALAYAIAKGCGAKMGYFPAAANSMGAYLAGALPHRLPGARPAESVGRSAAAMLTQPTKAFLLWGLEPDFDLADPAAARSALAAAEFVIACSLYRSASLEAVADVLLPLAGFAETAGTLVNGAGTWQTFQGAVAPPGDARPGWKLLRVLGSLLDLEGFDFVDQGEVLAELKGLCGGVNPDNAPRGAYELRSRAAATGLTRVGEVPLYALDPLVRRARSLQQTSDAIGLCARLNPREAGRLGLTLGDRVGVRHNGAVVEMAVEVDPTVADGCVRIPAAVPGSELLGPQIGAVTLEKV